MKWYNVYSHNGTLCGRTESGKFVNIPIVRQGSHAQGIRPKGGAIKVSAFNNFKDITENGMKRGQAHRREKDKVKNSNFTPPRKRRNNRKKQ